MIKIAITGGMGTGKSTLLSFFGQRNIPTWSADSVTKNIYEKDIYFKSILGKKLKIIGLKTIEDLKYNLYKYPDILEEIESYIHPKISLSRELFFNKNRKAEIVICEVPLLYEKNLEKNFDYIITTFTLSSLQWERCKKRKGMTIEMFNFLTNKQCSQNEKCKRSDYIIDMTKSFNDIEKEVDLFLKKIKEVKI